MWGLSVVSWNLIALLFGGGAVLALYFSATNADQKIAAANERAATLEKEAAGLRQTAVGLELDLEKERALRVKMQQAIAWRRINAEQGRQHLLRSFVRIR